MLCDVDNHTEVRNGVTRQVKGNEPQVDVTLNARIIPSTDEGVAPTSHRLGGHFAFLFRSQVATLALKQVSFSAGKLWQLVPRLSMAILDRMTTAVCIIYA